MVISPLAKAPRTSPAPLYGMWLSLVPDARSKRSMARWSSEPVPVVPTVTLPGFFLA
ncbi:hypothetical protein D3C78_1922440 [compost metagenome]